eukprot:1150312-Pelagomonas_calceolata.AAC.3
MSKRTTAKYDLKFTHCDGSIGAEGLPSMTRFHTCGTPLAGTTTELQSKEIMYKKHIRYIKKLNAHDVIHT